jgi:hypothetical protein
MEFVYAETLKEIFDAFAHFYNLRIGNNIFQCRNLLEIVSKDTLHSRKGLPDAVVIMMNPGSSRPLDKKYSPALYTTDENFSGILGKNLIPTRPDNAQYQIMRLMLLNEWKYVKVLNLSDLRNGNSGEFSKEFETASSIDPSNPHCITHSRRRRELNEALRTKSGHPIIAGWGSVGILKTAANDMIKLIPDLTGLNLETPWYKYPSPYKKDQKLSWLTEMDALVKNIIRK